MGPLAEAFYKEAAERKNGEWIRALCGIVQEAMAPFSTGAVTISLYEASFMDFGRTIRIDIETLPAYPFTFMIDERLLHAAYSPEQYLFVALWKPLFKHVRYRPTLPVDDHIVLGAE